MNKRMEMLHYNLSPWCDTALIVLLVAITACTDLLLQVSSAA